MTRFWPMTVTLTLLTTLALVAAQPAPGATIPGSLGYNITDLGNLGRDPTFPAAINARGDVAGSSMTASGQPHAFLLPAGGSMQDLGAMGGTASYATSLNNRGDVAGYFATAAGPTHAFAIIDPQMIDLGAQSAGASKAVGINDLRQVLVVTDAGGGNTSSALCQDGKATPLGTLGGSSTTGGALNNLGQVVGNATAADGATHAFVSDAFTHQLADLGKIGPEGIMTHVNEIGQAVGIRINVGARVGFDVNLKLANSLEDEIVYPGFSGTDACWINNTGTIAGAGELPAAPGSNATQWSPPDYDFMNLNQALLPNSGWILSSANAINDAGQIVGRALSPGGQPVAYMLMNSGPELAAEKSLAIAASLDPATETIRKGFDAAAKAATVSPLETALVALEQARSLLTPTVWQATVSGVNSGQASHLLSSAGNLLLTIPGDSPFLSPADRDGAVAIIAAAQKNIQ